MQRELHFTAEAAAQLAALKTNPAECGLYRQVLKTLGLLEINPRHPGLQTHQYESIAGVRGERVWEAYAQNRTPGAFRIFFHYGPDAPSGKKRVSVLTIIAITKHP